MTDGNMAESNMANGNMVDSNMANDKMVEGNMDDGNIANVNLSMCQVLSVSDLFLMNFDSTHFCQGHSTHCAVSVRVQWISHYDWGK